MVVFQPWYMRASQQNNTRQSCVSVFEFPDELIRLLGQGQRQDLERLQSATEPKLNSIGTTHGVRQDPCQMRAETLVDGEDAFFPHSLGYAVEGAGVQIAALVVHATHDRIRGMHEHTNHEAADGAARKVERDAVVHLHVLHEPPFDEEVCGQLDAAAETRSHTRRADAAVQAAKAFSAINLSQAVECVLVLVLRADGQIRREGLQSRLDQKEGRADNCTKNAGRCAAEEVDRQRLDGGAGVEERSYGLAHRFVEAETATIQAQLVDVLESSCISFRWVLLARYCYDSPRMSSL